MLHWLPFGSPLLTTVATEVKAISARTAHALFLKIDGSVIGWGDNDENQIEIVKKTCELAAKNSSAYFIFDRDTVTMAACCRLRTSLDPGVLEHPESIRFCGFQNITVNLPQAAYRAIEKGDSTIQGLINEVNDVMDLAFKAHVQRRKFVETLMKPGCPLWQIGKIGTLL